MSPRTLLIAVVSLGCGGALWVGHWYRRAAQQLETDRIAAVARQSSAQVEVERQRQRAAAADQALAELRAGLTAPRAIPSPEHSVRAALPPPTPMPFSPQEVLRKDPKLQLLYLQSERVTLAARYAPVLRRLGLAEKEVGQFNELVLRHAERIVDIQGAAQTQALALDDPAIERLRAAAEQDLRQEQRALLGDERYRQFEGMERVLPARGAIDDLAGRLVFTDEPLRPDQAERLTEAFAQASRAFRAGGKSDESTFDSNTLNYTPNGSLTPDGWRVPHPDNFDWPAVWKEAARILSPRQFAIFEASAKRPVTAMQLVNMAQDARLRGELTVPADAKPPGG